MPLPSAETTPPVTKTYFVGRSSRSRAASRAVELAQAPASARSARRATVRSPRRVRPASAPIASQRPRPVRRSRNSTLARPPARSTPRPRASPSPEDRRERAGRRPRRRRAAPASASAPSANAFSARPGRVSSWLSAFAARPTSSAPESERVRQSADSGDADELQDAGRAAGAQVRAEAALGPAPEVVGEPDRGDRQRRPARATPTTQPTSGSRRPRWLTRQRAAGEQDVAQLAAAVDEAARGRGRSRGARAASSTSSTSRPGADGVDRHPRLAAEAGREREAAPRARRPRARAGPRAARAPRSRSAQPDQRARRALREPEAAAAASAKAATRGRRRRRRAAARSPREVGVAEQQRARPAPRARPSVSAWPLPRRGSRSDARAGRLGRVRGRRRASRRRRRRPRRPGTAARSAVDGRADPRLLVARGDEDGDGSATGSSATGQRLDRRQDPSSAVSRTP